MSPIDFLMRQRVGRWNDASSSKTNGSRSRRHIAGLHVHVINGRRSRSRGVSNGPPQEGHIVVARGEVECELPPRGRVMFAADALLGGFFDVN